MVSLKSDLKKDLCKYIKSDSQLLIFKITLDYLLLQYMRTFSIHTSQSHACTPSTAVKIHPGNSQPPIQPHVNPPNILKLLHFSLSIDATYTDHNPQPTEHRRSVAGYSFVFPYINTIQQRTAASLLRPQTNKYYNCTYLPCVWNTDFSFWNYFCFWRERERDCLPVAVAYLLLPPPPPTPTPADL